MKILLLEDNIALSKAIKKVLNLNSYKVDCYTDGAKVVEKIKEKIYSLYILDINVPNISGLEILKLLMEINPESKVIIITSNSDLESLKESYSLGCVDFIKKPFYIEELQLKIDKLDINSVDCMLKDKNCTKKEYRLLQLLVDNINNTVTYKTIEEEVYKDKLMTMDSLRALIKRLRSKLIDKDLIQNIQNRGYMMSE